MTSLTDLWINNKDFILSKSIQQVIGMCGNGKLRDNSESSNEFRAFLDNIPSSLLGKYASECLENSFNDSGLALQDLVNQIGSRIGFQIEYGLYQGRKNQIGFDGIWTAADDYSIIVEVKTTDAYRMNLDVISEYRSALIKQNRISDRSSILIVVGRKDTGDLEAQIRGSQHAWDIRLISTDAIINLMKIRENLNDARTIQQINEVLKPQEYTRLDRLIDVIFTTTQDVSTFDSADKEILNESELENQLEAQNDNNAKVHPVSFHDDCIEKIQKFLKQPLIKKSRTGFSTADNTIAVICSISKQHGTPNSPKYWFAFHPYYIDFLKKAQKSYIAYGCGSANLIALIPFEVFEPFIKDFWTTKKEDRMYWHVVIHEKENTLLLQCAKKNELINLSEFILK